MPAFGHKTAKPSALIWTKEGSNFDQKCWTFRLQSSKMYIFLYFFDRYTKTEILWNSYIVCKFINNKKFSQQSWLFFAKTTKCQMNVAVLTSVSPWSFSALQQKHLSAAALFFLHQKTRFWRLGCFTTVKLTPFDE